MNEITRKIWESGQTIQSWSQTNGFKAAYVRQIIIRRYGKWRVGCAGKIIAALKRDGFWVDQDEQAMEQAA